MKYFAIILLSLIFISGAFIGCEDTSDEKDSYVEDNFANSDMDRGGRLYDKWWKVNDETEPTGDHPLYPDASAKSGSTTWRCKECHGWDYIGDLGRYSDGSHYTGISGIEAALNSNITEVFNSIKDVGGDHDFSSVLSDEDILDLTKFVTEGQIDMTTYIDESGLAIGNISNGQSLFEASCGSSNCHGMDGNSIDFDDDDDGDQGLGFLSNDNPPETFHKILWGQPNSYMPSMIGEGKTTQECADILAYAQTLTSVTNLNVAQVTAAPANATDAAWDEADALELALGENAAYSSVANVLTDLTLKAVRTSSTLYILAEWMDNSATESVDKNQWTYSAADGWTKSGNEDRIFFMFDAGDNGTEGADCATMCHVATGEMKTTGGGHVDVWHGKGARSFPVGTVDDKWWDTNGRGSDAKTVGAYSDNKQTLADGSTVPMYSGDITDGHYIIIASGGTTDDLTLFDTTSTSGVYPGYILNENYDGSRFGDVSADASYDGGKWTVMFSRALDTTHDDDVAFSTTSGSQVQMTVAVTDNSGGSHVGSEPFYIIF